MGGAGPSNGTHLSRRGTRDGLPIGQDAWANPAARGLFVTEAGAIIGMNGVKGHRTHALM